MSDGPSADAITEAPSHRYTARILHAYRRLGYQFFDCFTSDGKHIGIAARSIHHAREHAKRINRHGGIVVLRLREVTPPRLDKLVEYIDDGCGETSEGV